MADKYEAQRLMSEDLARAYLNRRKLPHKYYKSDIEDIRKTNPEEFDSLVKAQGEDYVKILNTIAFDTDNFPDNQSIQGVRDLEFNFDVPIGSRDRYLAMPNDPAAPNRELPANPTLAAYYDNWDDHVTFSGKAINNPRFTGLSNAGLVRHESQHRGGEPDESEVRILDKYHKAINEKGK